MPKLPTDPDRWLSPIYDDPQGRHLLALAAHCPACDEEHVFRLGVWGFNGDYEKPTFDGSMLFVGPEMVCHSFLENGEWRFLADCTHALAGQTVPMVRIKSWGEITGRVAR